MRQQSIALHEGAPPKPASGEPCNGCGVCCAYEPCPVAMVFLFQRKGACRALLWQEEEGRYACGMVRQPHRHSRLIPRILASWLGAFFATRIAAGGGCDAGIEIGD